jgi:hypothetical protein
MFQNVNYEDTATKFDRENASWPHKLNCAVFIKEIPIRATNKDILRSVREGKVFSYSKIDPDGERYPKCVASLTFKTRRSA